MTNGSILDGENLKRWGSTLIGDANGPGQNLLINGGFDFAQRQPTPVATPSIMFKYGADRWYLATETAYASCTYSRNLGVGEAGLTSKYYGTYAATATGKMALCQVLESTDTEGIRNRASIFQIKMKANVATSMRICAIGWSGAQDAPTSPIASWNANGTDPTLATSWALLAPAQTMSVGTSWATFSWTCIPNNMTNVAVIIWTANQMVSGNSFSVAEAGFYASVARRIWTPRPVALEFELCQRYFEKSPGDIGLGMIISSMITTGNKSAQPWVPFQMTKRIVPTVTLKSAGTGSLGYIAEYNPSGVPVQDLAQGVVASEYSFWYYTGASASAGNTLRFMLAGAEAELI